MIIQKGHQHDGAAITARRSWVQFMATWSMHVLPVSVLVPSWYSGFLSESTDMHVGLIGDCKLPTGVNGCLSLYVSTVDLSARISSSHPDHCAG